MPSTAPAPTITRETVTDTLEPFAGAELISLASLARRMRETVGVDFNPKDRSYAVSRGLIDVAGIGQQGRKQITGREAERIVLAACCAVLAGMALVTVLGAIKPGLAAGIIKAAQAAVLVP
jgi:hypothetical protein